MNKPFLTAFLFASTLLSTSVPLCSQSSIQSHKPAWLNTSRSIEQRVNDLVGKMTLEEKISQMVDRAPAIPRLGVPKYDWWNESLHGVARAGYATNFPQVIGMAASWDTALVHRIADVTSTEARAKYNQAMRDNDHEMYFGLTFWAPNINIFRDPRWGRGQETYGEDPYLTGRMAVAFVSGMQGNDPKYLKVVSTPKHFAVHSGPEALRHKFNVNPSSHDLEDTYLPAFRAAVTEANAQSVMCAYNSIDGAPACANAMLLQQHLRNYWHFSGYVVSDCAAIADIFNGHQYASDAAHAAAFALNAGTDIECGWQSGQAYPALLEAVKSGLLTEAEIDTSVKRLFRARFKLGMFDPPSSYAYGRIPFTENNSAEHRKVALQAARESIVLLKNDSDVLPFGKNIHNISVVGPTAELVQSIQGNYNGAPPQPVFPIAGIEDEFKDRVTYAQGSVLAEGLAIPIEHTALKPLSGPGEGLTAEYFDSDDFSGKPVLVRNDRTINFNWESAEPVTGLKRDGYSVRWRGSFLPPAPGDYELGVQVGGCHGCPDRDRFRLFLDDNLLVDDGKGTTASIPIHFSDVTPHAIRLEYIHTANSAGVDLIWKAPASALRDEALRASANADVIVAFVGLSPNLEGEEMSVKLEGFSDGDRTDIALPRSQQELLEALGTTGKPLVVVLTSGSALAVNWAQQHAAAVIELWYPGEEGGTAIAETLAGKNNPAGRLPLTFYSSIAQLPDFTDYSMKNRTYRYFDGKPLYGFGYGLSYSHFNYANLKLSDKTIRAGSPINVEVDVTNSSSRDGDEVVELYLTQPQTPLTPLRNLAGFKRIHVDARKTVHVGFQLDQRSLGQVDTWGIRKVLPGSYRVAVGGSQPGDLPGGATASFEVTGSLILPQ